jgi:DNA-binding response OmpR family regulator
MEGFEKLKKMPLIYILDVMMPYKDGYTLAKEIREKKAKFLLYSYCKIDERGCFKRLQGWS